MKKLYCDVTNKLMTEEDNLINRKRNEFIANFPNGCSISFNCTFAVNSVHGTGELSIDGALKAFKNIWDNREKVKKEFENEKGVQ